jgi:transposase
LDPKQAGDRVNTDRREAGQLARWARSGDLTAVYVPPVEAAAMRDLTRAHEETISPLKDAKCRLNACWLRQASRKGGRARWGPAPLQWLAEVVCPTPAQQIVCQESVRAVHEPTERLQRLEQARREYVHAWRGVPFPVAVTVRSAIGDLTRVVNPRALMKCLGLSPSD